MNRQGLRIAAARLAALHPGDRAWLLQQLPPAQVGALQELLRSPELKRWGNQLAGLEIPPPTAAPLKADAPMPPASLPAALKQADPGWIALWLAARAPEDRECDLESLGPIRAREVREEVMRHAQPLPTSLRDALAQWPGRADSFAEWL